MIIKLPSNVANQIAAGEVIERASSVVKELVENSIDANSKSIEIEIVNSGRDLIRVRDDGDGIEEADMPLVFHRSATSKIKTLDDIYNLVSLGFRGEALASIASVARCELSSAREGEEPGRKLTLSSDIMSGIEYISFKKGTEISVRDLFYNTPVRYKFLKSAAVEKSRVIKTVAMLALSHPGISFRLVSDGQEVLNLKGVNDLKKRISAVYGRELYKALIPISASANEIEISGYIADPSYSLGNRSQQFFIVNGRVADADILKKAMNDAYEGLLMKHRHQAYVININLPPNMVDVNVHPQKLEVKFDREDIIYSLIFNAARNALIAERSRNNEPVGTTYSYIVPETALADYAKADAASYGSLGADERAAEDKNRELTSGAELPAAEETEDSYEKRYLKQLIERISAKREEENPKASKKIEYDAILEAEELRELEYSGALKENDDYEYDESEDKDDSSDASAYLKVDFSKMRLIGQALRTYIILEEGDKIYMVDQHAAHERVLFERFYSEFKSGKIVSQMLISPYVIDIPRGEEATYQEGIEYLKSLGIEIDIENDSVVVRSLPVFNELISIEDMKQILESYMEHGRHSYTKNFMDMIIMKSCKSAIKSGDELNEVQMRDLLRMLNLCENSKSCPHGRPVMIEMERRYLDKLFKRIV